MRLLLVDNDGVNRYTVSKALQRVGYLVSEVNSGEAALERYDKSDFDLVISEIELPGIDGIAVLQGIRQQAPEAVVLLMTERASVDTAVQALRFGAHDYLVRPCSSDDICQSVERGIANARVQLRRRRLLDSLERNVLELAREATNHVDAVDFRAEARIRQRAPRGAAIKLGPFDVQPGKYQIEANGKSASLTPTEFDLLLYLAAHRVRVVASQELVREVRGYHTEESEAREVIRPHVSNLRRKLKRLSDVDLIVNVRGVGYRLGEIAEQA